MTDISKEETFQIPEEVRKRHGDVTKLYDMIIIGGGPAGMTAAVYASRKKVSVLMITENLGGQVLLTSTIENYLGYMYITGWELSEKFSMQMHKFSIDLEMPDCVSRLEPVNRIFKVHTEAGKIFTAKSLVISSGKRSKSLDVPCEEELIGRGVTYCSVCDAPLFKGKTVSVVGAGNSAFTAAVDLLSYAKKIYLINKDEKFGCDAVLFDKIKSSPIVEIITNAEVTHIEGSDYVTGIKLRDIKTGESKNIPLEGVFIEIGLVPNSDFSKDTVALNEMNEIIVDCACRTSMPGVFACGDVTSVPEKQIIVAAGEGAKASLSAYQYIITLKP